MLKIVGMGLIGVSFLASVYAILSYLKYIRTGNETDLNLGNILHKWLLYILSGVGVLLFYFIVTHDFSIQYVASYSSTKEPWYYLISTFWAGQEGTFYLWLLYTVIFGMFVIRQKNEFVPHVMVVLHVTVFFLLLLLLARSPFRPLDPNILINLADGRGLNPLLKNPWMVIHPPTLFLGYSSVAVTAAYAIAGLWTRKTGDWIKHCFPWTLFTTAVLGLGVIMGGYWAYVVLGWGGYWAWDPVENASVFPWFLMVAAFHGMLIYRSVKGFLKTTVVLSILAYWMMLYGSFLTRSGILEEFSVHSFSSLGLNHFLIAFIVAYTLMGAYFFITRWSDMPGEKLQDKFNKEMVLAFTVILFVLSTFVLWIGTSKPFFTSLIGEAQASAQADLYNDVFSYIAVFMMAFLATAPLLKWKREGLNINRSRFIVMLIASVGAALPVLLVDPELKIIFVVIFALALWALVVNSYNVYRFFSSPPLRASGVTHVGLALMVIGIMASSTLGDDLRIKLNKNEPVERMGMSLTYVERQTTPGDETITYIVQGKAETDVFRVPMEFSYSDFNRSYMRKPHIVRKPTEDLYFSPVNLVEFAIGKEAVLKQGETLKFDSLSIRFEGFQVLEMNPNQGVFRVNGRFSLSTPDTTITTVAEFAQENGATRSDIQTLNAVNYSFKIIEVNATDKAVKFVYGHAADQIVLEQLEIELSTKPLIYVLWLGTIILVIGLSLSTSYRLRIMTRGI